MKANETTEERGALNPERIYLGDNGRCFCGKLECAGASAFFTGHDLSGQRVYHPDAYEFEYAKREGITLRCESCGKVEG